MLHTLFENLADGDAIAEAALTSIYLPVAANMAADMNCTEIQLADLIQEANVVLLTALSDPETERKDAMLGCVFSFVRELSRPLRSRHRRNSRMTAW